MYIQPSKNSIKMTIIDNLDSGKLIIIDPTVDEMARDMAFAEVAKKTGIPIFTTRERAYHLNALACDNVAWYTETDILNRGKDEGFMVDIGIPILKVMTLKNIPIRSANFRLRTGFYLNDIFSHDFIRVDYNCPSDDGDCNCGCPTPVTPYPPTPPPGCPTPQPCDEECAQYKCFKPLFNS